MLRVSCYFRLSMPCLKPLGSRGSGSTLLYLSVFMFTPIHLFVCFSAFAHCLSARLCPSQALLYGQLVLW